MSKKYYHELTDQEISDLLATKPTMQHIIDTYSQPDWCNIDDGVHYVLGCNSLTHHELRKHISKEFCSTCVFCKQTKL